MARLGFFTSFTLIVYLLFFILGFSSGIKELITINRLGENKNLIILNATSLDETADGILYIVDSYANKIKLIDKKGVLLREFGKRGKSSGDFLKLPFLIKVFKNGLAIAEFNSSRILIFNKEFKFLHSFNVNGTVIDISADLDDNLWIGILDIRGKASLVCYNVQGRLLKSMELNDDYTKNSGYVNLFSFDISKSNLIVVAYSFLNKIEIWNTNGRFVKEFKVDGLPDKAGEKLISINLFSKEFIPEGILFRDIAVSHNNMIYILGGSYSKKPSQDIYIFNTSGNFINEITLPDKVSNIYLNSSGELLTIEKNYSVIGIYKLK